jgi:hypothetical protein
MEHDEKLPFGVDAFLFDAASSLAARVTAARKAQGKAIPSDFAEGSPEADAVALDFVRDIESALHGGPKALTEGH